MLSLRYWLIPGLSSMLLLIGLLTLQSVAKNVASHQLIFALLGVTVFAVTSRLPFQTYLTWRWPNYLFLCFMLVVTLLFGEVTRGSTNWLSVGGWFSIQSSQMAVPLVGLVLAYLAAKTDFKKVSSLALALSLLAIPGILIFIAPDFGTTIIYLLSMSVIVLIGPTPAKYIFTLFTVAVILAIVGWYFVLHPYQKTRITSFIAPDQNETASYNAQQALIAVGSGQLYGRGLGEGIQSHLRFLPEYQTDFIFASTAEEWGFVGAALIILIFCALIGYLFFMAFTSNNTIGKYYLAATATALATQATIHIGMNMSMFPITGITLPLISYGGSSLLSIMFSLGVAQTLVPTLKIKKTVHIE